MKKSKMYELAMLAVIESQKIPTPTKVDIIRELMEKEDMEKFREKCNEESEDKSNECAG